MSSEVIRDVIIRIAVKMGAIELPTPDFSKWGAGIAADINRVVQSQMNQVVVPGQSAGTTKSYDPAFQRQAPPTSAKSYDAHVRTFEQAQREAQAGTNKAYAQEEIRRQREQTAREKRLMSDFSQATGAMKKDETARYAGSAKAYGQDETKRQREEAEKLRGVAKSYAQEEEKKIRLQEEAAKVAEDSQRRQVEAAGQMRMSFGQATDGLFQMARGWALNKAAAEGNLESAVRGFAKFQAVIDQTKGSILLVQGLAKAYDALRISVEAAKVAETARAAATKLDATGIAGAGAGSARLSGMGTSASLMMNPFVLATLAATAGVHGYNAYNQSKFDSLDEGKQSGLYSGSIGDYEVRRQRELQGKINTRGTSGFVRGVADFGGYVFGNAERERIMQGHSLMTGFQGGFATGDQLEENKEFYANQEANRKKAVEAQTRLNFLASENQATSSQAGQSSKLFGTEGSQRVVDLKIAAMQRAASMQDKALREGLSQDAESRRLMGFGARTTSEASNIQSAFQTRANEVQMRSIAAERGRTQERLGNIPADGSDIHMDQERTRLQETLVNLKQREDEITRQQTDQLRENLRLQQESASAIKDAIRGEERRGKSMDQQIGEMDIGKRAEFKRYAEMSKDDGIQGLNQKQLKRFSELGGIEIQNLVGQEFARRGEKYRTEQGDAFATAGVNVRGEGSVTEELKKWLADIVGGPRKPPGSEGTGVPVQQQDSPIDVLQKKIKEMTENQHRISHEMSDAFDALLAAQKDTAKKAAEAAKMGRENAAGKTESDSNHR